MIEIRRLELVIFLQGDDAEEPLRLVDTYGPIEGFNYLRQWDYGEPAHADDVEIVAGYPALHWGRNEWHETDRGFHEYGGYLMGCNWGYGVCVLYRVTPVLTAPVGAFA